MASLRLLDVETKPDGLPMVCMACGRPAEVRVRRRFSWHPPWVIGLVVFCILPYAVLAYLLTRTKAVDVPLCGRHRGYWVVRSIAVVGGLFAVIGFAVCGGLLAANAPPYSGDWSGLVCLGTVLAFVAWVVFASVIQYAALRPAQIDDTTITLVNVSEGFVDAVFAERKARQGGRRRPTATAKPDDDPAEARERIRAERDWDEYLPQRLPRQTEE